MKVAQGCRISPEARDNIYEVREKFLGSATPTAIVSIIVEKIFSKEYSLEQAIEEVTKVKNFVIAI
jgi:hypothetical protein